MEATPGTSKASAGITLLSPSPPKKRKELSLGHLSLREKQAILNMYKKILDDEPTLTTVKLVSKIAITLGVAKSTVYRIIKEYKSTKTVSTSKQCGGRPGMITLFDEATKNSIRRIVHGFFFSNEIPTLDKILNEIKNHQDLPQMSRSTLYKFMKQINFRYLKRNRKSVMIERDDIVRWRVDYLTSIKKFRSEGRPIYYLDETWLNEGHTKGKVWVDNNIKSKREAFIEGLSTGLKNPSGKGKRLIILHAGSEEGFVEDSLLVFEGKKSGDYHEEMNANVFEKWFVEFLRKLPDNAVIVMDNASYHSRKVESIPTTSTRKSDMKAWLQSKNIGYEENMVRSQLLHLIRQNKHKYNLYITDEMAKKENKVVLRLPPYHCELNPIEMIWAQVKNEVAGKNKTFKLKDVKELLIEALNNVTKVNWQKCVEHVIKEEEKMSTLDGIIDDLIEPLIISVNNMESDADTTDTDSSIN
ncbi:hypothetical protein NQ315_014769 [Exocentrus adspersus]|uniref:Tc1-like transposase DDE domain-containing protein n=1 Tax=Exocentrus adspersus TaxID=1586481 RepID=A0AAV8VMQ5_9CUCU|nr:hypothetical protein NQ315_014769 [Exocentrus adspersus]